MGISSRAYTPGITGRLPRLCTRLTLIPLLSAALAGCTSGDEYPVIVFQSSRDGNFELYTMHADGSSQKRLTNSPANDVTPVWSPDGSRIAFATDRDGNWEIYTVRPDGTDLSRLTRGEGSNTAPSWTPDGSAILFISSRETINGDVYLMRTDGSDVRRLTDDPLVKDTPVMTPDGKTVLVTINTRERFTLAAYPVGGGPPTQLTPSSFNSRQPRIGPDGETALFLADRDGPVDVYMLALNRPGPIERITRDPDRESAVAWAGENSRILFARWGRIVLLTLPDGPAIVLSSKGDGAPDWRME